MIKELWMLFITFAKVGVMTFGGGAAMLPMLQREVQNKKQWVTEDELMDYYAIGQCTPGVIAVNTATFIGHKQRGVIGAIAATLGMIFPSLVIIMTLAGIISNFADVAWVQSAFAGIRACVSVQILNAVIKLYQNSVVDKCTLGIFVVVLLGSVFTPISPVIFVLLAAVAGLVLKMLEVKGK